MDKSFSQLIFGKPLANITFSDLLSYFETSRTESDILEFKSFQTSITVESGRGREDEKKVLKTITAFLNSAGGILIWGAPEGIKGTEQKESVFQGALTPSHVLYEKDSFINKIANRIISAPSGISFHRIGDLNGGYLYLIEVPASEYAPHQFENVYYMRMDGQTVPAPHHYIEAKFRKVSFPKLEGYLRLDSYIHNESNQGVLSCTLIFRNQSRYQNDENLHCRVISDHGKVLRIDSAVSPTNQMLTMGSDYVVPRIADVIYYGNYLHHEFKLILSRDHLYQSNYEIKLVVAFGARYSPMKVSHYTVKVGPMFPAKKSEAIVFKRENLFFHENEQVNGMTDTDVLDRILNDGNTDTFPKLNNE